MRMFLCLPQVPQNEGLAVEKLARGHPHAAHLRSIGGAAGHLHRREECQPWLQMLSLPAPGVAHPAIAAADVLETWRSRGPACR